MKICSKCKQNKEDKLFGKSSKNKDKLHSWCKKCVSIARMKRYYENHEEERFRGNKRNEEARRSNIIKIWEYFEDHPCIDCGEADPKVLEFDHLDPSIKIDNISSMVRRYFDFEKIENEIKKCEVRCANCHRRKTAKQFGWYEYMAL